MAQYGILPHQDVGIAIAGPNAPEWVISDIASVFLGWLSVPLAEHTTPIVSEYVLNLCKVRVVVCSALFFERVVRDIYSKLPDLCVVITMTKVADSRLGSSVSVMSFAECENIVDANDLKIFEVDTFVNEDRLCTVLLTSGSTGMPKAASRSYKQYLSLCCAYSTPQPSVHLCFQPLSHLSGRIMIPTVLFNGGQIGFSSGDAHLLFEEAKTLRPTFFNGVPRVFNVLYNM